MIVGKKFGAQCLLWVEYDWNGISFVVWRRFLLNCWHPAIWNAWIPKMICKLVVFSVCISIKSRHIQIVPKKLDQRWRATRAKNNGWGNFGIHESIHQVQIEGIIDMKIKRNEKKFHLTHCVAYLMTFLPNAHTRCTHCCLFVFLRDIFWSNWKCARTHFHCIAHECVRV